MKGKQMRNKLIAVLLFAIVGCASQPKSVIFTPPPAGAESVILGEKLADAAVFKNVTIEHRAAPSIVYDVKAYRDGKLIWEEVRRNTVLTAGKTQLLDCQFAGSGCIGTWYVMLKHTGAINAADTMASHAGWTEANPYAGDRPAVSWSAASGNSKVASAAVSITMNATDADVKGACLTSNTTRAAATGTAYSCTDFAVARSVVSGDIVTVTPTVTD